MNPTQQQFFLNPGASKRQFLINFNRIIASLTVGLILAGCQRSSPPEPKSRSAEESAPPRAAPTESAPTGPRAPNTVAAPSEIELPAFPWPPPSASAQVEIQSELLRSRTGPTTLAEVATKLEGAIKKANYRKWSYSSVPRGFALVTQMEQIRPDGTPAREPARWSIDLPPMTDLSLLAFIKALVIAPVGSYRVIVFIATDAPWGMDGKLPTAGTARKWLSQGFDRLPTSLGANAYGEGYTTKALVYEFKKDSKAGEAAFVEVSEAPAAKHLEQAGILKPLTQ